METSKIHLSTCNQLPLEYQVLSDHLIHEDNGVSCESIGQWAGISAGTVVKLPLELLKLFYRCNIKWFDGLLSRKKKKQKSG